jgi:hypothetical protein
MDKNASLPSATRFPEPDAAFRGQKRVPGNQRYLGLMNKITQSLNNSSLDFAWSKYQALGYSIEQQM